MCTSYQTNNSQRALGRQVPRRAVNRTQSVDSVRLSFAVVPNRNRVNSLDQRLRLTEVT